MRNKSYRYVKPFPAKLPEALEREIKAGANWLQVWRLQHPITDDALVKASGLPLARIREIEADATYPEMEEIEAIARALGTTADEIIAIQD